MVTYMRAHHDKLSKARILVDGDTLLFDMSEARIIGALFVKGDSVKVNYIDGKGDTLRALVVSVIPKDIHFITPSEPSSDTLITAPAETAEEAAAQ